MDPLDLLVAEWVAKADTTTTNMAAIIPQLWASTLEPNLRKREQFQQSIAVNTDLVGEPGDRVFLPTLPDLDDSGMDLTEDVAMSIIALSDATSVELIPAEKGKAIGITRKALDRMKYGGMELLVDRLAYSMSQKIENTISNLYSASVPNGGASMTIYRPNGKTAATIATTDTLNDDAILDVKAILEGEDAIPFDDGSYRLYIHPNQYKALIKDPDIRNDLRYASPAVLLRGEVGSLHGVRIVVSNYVKTLVENTVTTYQSLLMSDRWAAIAWKRMPEVTLDPTVYDMGRRRQVGITADFDIELIHAERAIVVRTA